jgi:hypothetical protein
MLIFAKICVYFSIGILILTTIWIILNILFDSSGAGCLVFLFPIIILIPGFYIMQFIYYTPLRILNSLENNTLLNALVQVKFDFTNINLKTTNILYIILLCILIIILIINLIINNNYKKYNFKYIFIALSIYMIIPFDIIFLIYFFNYKIYVSVLLIIGILIKIIFPFIMSYIFEDFFIRKIKR